MQHQCRLDMPAKPEISIGTSGPPEPDVCKRDVGLFASFAEQNVFQEAPFGYTSACSKDYAALAYADVSILTAGQNRIEVRLERIERNLASLAFVPAMACAAPSDAVKCGQQPSSSCFSLHSVHLDGTDPVGVLASGRWEDPAVEGEGELSSPIIRRNQSEVVRGHAIKHAHPKPLVLPMSLGRGSEPDDSGSRCTVHSSPQHSTSSPGRQHVMLAVPSAKRESFSSSARSSRRASSTGGASVVFTPSGGRPDTLRARFTSWWAGRGSLRRSFGDTRSWPPKETRLTSLWRKRLARSKSQVVKDESRKDTFTTAGKFKTLLHSQTKSLIADNESSCAGGLAHMVVGTPFQAFFTLVIFSEFAFVYYSTNYEMSNVGSGRSELIGTVQLTFLVLYFVEFLLKVLALVLVLARPKQGRKAEYWHRLWSVLGDMVLLVCSALDYLAYSAALADVSFVKAIRFVKVAKLFRIFRVTTFFPELSLMFTSIFSTLTSVVWSILLMAITLYITSVLFVQGATIALEQRQLDRERDEEVFHTFGSVSKGMLNLYMVSSDGGSISEMYGIVSKLGWLYAGIFLLIHLFIQISILNIITSLFMESVMKHVEEDREAAAGKYWRKQSHEAAIYKKICDSMAPESKKEVIDAEELGAYMRNTDWSLHWAPLGIEKDDVRDFFALLTCSMPEKKVNVKEFVSGCMKMKGTASSLDMQNLLFIVTEMKKELSAKHLGRPTTGEKSQDALEI